MAFQQGLSGLATASKALDAISNNVSNSGTVGYKQSTAQFADVFAASLVGGSSQVGIGASVGTVAQQFTQGNINTSSNPLDLAINGQGFFQMQSPDGTETYSRNGQFQTDKSGYIVNAQGLRLTGKVADANGLITDTTGPLKLNTTQAAPQATTTAGYGLNFDSRAKTPSSLTAAKGVTGAITFPYSGIAAGDNLTFLVDNNAPVINVSFPASMVGKNYADAQSLVTDLQSAIDATGLKGRITVSATGAGEIVYTSTGTGRLSNMTVSGAPTDLSSVTVTPGDSSNFSINDPASYTSSTSQTVYDSLGNPHTQTLYFVKTAQANVWDVYSSLDGVMPKPVVVTATTPSTNDYRLATITFNQSGGLTSLSTPDPAGTGTDVVSSTLSVNPKYDLFNGAATALQFGVDFKGTTQFGSNFSVDQLTQDGYAPGQLSGLTIDANGIIQGNFTNGRSKNMGQIQLVNFANPNGLRSLGGNQWTVTAAAGQVTPGTPGSGVLGVIQSGAVEESNVDLTAELVNMITQQRSYQANAQSIKTQDQVLQTLVNLR